MAAKTLYDFSRLITLSQESGSQLSENEVIYFVLPKDKTDVTCSTDLSYAFQICQERSIPCKWMENEACMEYEPKSKNMFVLDPFFTPAYDKLVMHELYREEKIEIIGPRCLQYALEGVQGFSIKSKACPPINLAMKNVMVTFTGFSHSEKEREEQLELSKLVELMNGKVKKSYTAAVTHVVAKDVISDKSIAAHQYEVPVMQPEWITAVWHKSKTDLVTAEDSYFKTYVCPPFYNLSICLSQLSQSNKTKYRQMVESYGGIYTSELLRQKTRVLVVPEPVGEKYNSAKKWNIPCVTPEWIERSIDCGYAISPERFAINRDGPLTSTPKKTDKNFMSDLSIATISSTASKLDWKKNSLATNSVITFDLEERIESLKIAQDKPPFLDGCTVFLCGRVNQKSMVIRKLLNTSGAVRIDRLNEGVTHVLVLSDYFMDSEIQAIENLSVRPAVVSLEWLISSAELGYPADVKKFNVDITKKPRTFSFKSTGESSKPLSNSSIPFGSGVDVDYTCFRSESHDNVDKEDGSQNSWSHSSTVQEKNGGYEDSASAYSNSKDTITRGRSTRESVVADFKIPDCVDIDSIVRKSESKKPDLSQKTDSLLEKSSVIQFLEESITGSQALHGVFYKQSIKICLENEKEAEIIQNIVIENDGSICTGRDYNIIVLPPVYSKEVELNSSGLCWTKYRIIDCADKKTITLPEELYHVPFRQFEDMNKTLSGCVLAFSQYSSKHKEYFTAVAASLGAMVQDIFAKKNSKERGFRKTTHLICSVSTNEKFLMAQKWGVHVAVAEWLSECLKKKELVAIKPFNPLIFTHSTPTVSFPKNMEEAKLHEMEPLRNVDEKSCGLSTVTSYEQLSVSPNQHVSNEMETGNKAGCLTRRNQNFNKKTKECKNREQILNKTDLDDDLTDNSLATESGLDPLDISDSPHLTNLTHSDTGDGDTVLNDFNCSSVSMNASKLNSEIEIFDPNKSYSFSFCQNNSSSFMAQCENDVIKDYLFDGGFVPLRASPLFKFKIPKPGTPEVVVARRTIERIIDQKELEAKEKRLMPSPGSDNCANSRVTAGDFMSSRSMQKEKKTPESLNKPVSTQIEPDIDDRAPLKEISSCSERLEEEEHSTKRKSESPLSSPIVKKRAIEDVEPDSNFIQSLKADREDSEKFVCQVLDVAQSIRDSVVHVHQMNKHIEELESTVMQLGGIVGELNDPNMKFIVVPECIENLELPKSNAKLISSKLLYQFRENLALVHESLQIAPDPDDEPQGEEPCNRIPDSQTPLADTVDEVVNVEEEVIEPLEYPMKSRSSLRAFSDLMTKELSSKISVGNTERRSKKRISTEDMLQKVDDAEDDESQRMHQSQDLAALDVPQVAWAEDETIRQEAFNHPMRKGVKGSSIGPRTRGKLSRKTSALSIISPEIAPPRVTRSSSLKTQSKVLEKAKDPEFPENPVFLFSGLKAKEKDEAIKALTPLGASFSEKWTPLCTGLIQKSLARSEKLMNCVASCKCVLKWSYIGACVKANKLLNVTDFLWSEEDADTDFAKKVASAIRNRFFQKQKNPDFKPLEGWKFFFCDGIKQKLMYKNLIECGGGCVVDEISASNCVLIVGANDMRTNVPSHIRQESPQILAELILGESSQS